MLSKIPFYHQTIKKSVIAFGKLFNDIYIVNKDYTNKTRKIIKVPIAYGPKEKYFVHSKEDPTLSKEISTTLPRISFEIISIRYDNARKTPSINKISNNTIDSLGNPVLYRQFSPVPYTVDVRLYTLTRTTEDALQIVEQILPFFTPTITLNVNTIPEMGIRQDIPVTLLGLSVTDTYDGSFVERREIIYTIDFEMKIELHQNIKGMVDHDRHFDGDASSGKSIKKVIVDFDEQGERQSVAVNPLEADKDDIYTIDEFIGDIPSDEP
jgi:hypothetical protein